MENYQKILDKTIENLNGGETLLLHSCCGPCSSYVLEYLSQYFKITILFYNPNISPQSEFDKRVVEQKKVIENTKAKYPIDIIVDKYDPDEFYERVKPYKDLGEKS
ncbi:MAG: epoxyqueuosine reductase QueH, partial [Finegoldia magna]|nr:epoxyqueuosine reductase QueH [Finegoldia magna]